MRSLIVSKAVAVPKRMPMISQVVTVVTANESRIQKLEPRL